MRYKSEICILLATYNGEKFINEQLKSIENQTTKNIKIIVSDDQSSDNTIDKIIKFGKKSKVNIEILKPKNSFLVERSHANNFFKLILYAKISKETNWIAFSDQDDIWLKNKLSRAIDFLKNNNNYGGYSSSVTAFWGKKRIHISKVGFLHKYNHFFESAGPGCTYVLKKEAFLCLRNTLKRNLDILKNINYADWAIYSIVRSNNFLWHIDKQSYILYRQHSNNAIGIANSLDGYKFRIKKIINGWYRSQIFWLTLINNCQDIILIQRIIKLSFIDRFKLFFMAFLVRRKIKDKFILALSYFFMKKLELPKFITKNNKNYK